MEVNEGNEAAVGLDVSQDDQAGMWYYPPNGKYRTRYMFCTTCDFKTTGHGHLNAHMKKYHPSTETDLMVGASRSHLKGIKPTYEAVKTRYKEMQVCLIRLKF